MDVVKISLEALLQRATNPQNQNTDTAAVEAFCALINKEKDGPFTGIKLLAGRIHSKDEQEVLQTLHIIDVSMQKCGFAFQSEVGKFRFLNEMIKLVSPKYLADHTPLSVKLKVLQLLYLWTQDYPRETKIKEAYEMLKKQGVIREVPLSVSAENCGAPEQRGRNGTLFQDDERSKLLKKLLQSKNPEDLQAANRLIKSMVKEDEKKAELKSKIMSEVESVQNNVRLLNEMLDSYKASVSSLDELDLIKELHESCQRLRPRITKLATEAHSDDLGSVLLVNDELGQVFDKFRLVIVEGKILAGSAESDSSQACLLDFVEGDRESPLAPRQNSETNPATSTVDDLCDIFSIPNFTKDDAEEEILKPTAISNAGLVSNGDSDNKLKALEDLDALSENLLKENLQFIPRIGSQFKKNTEKIPMNLLRKDSQTDKNTDAFDFDLMTLMNNKTGAVEQVPEPKTADDDVLVDIREDTKVAEKEVTVEKSEEVKVVKNAEVKLSDLFVELNDIKPSSVMPINALEEKNGISVTLHFAKDRPRDDVAVVVVSIASKNELPLKNILFRAIVPKVCKVKLQSPSATELPAYNPFLPAAAITQVMLIANPENVTVSLKLIVSYNIDDETLTEMGEIESLPIFARS